MFPCERNILFSFGVHFREDAFKFLSKPDQFSKITSPMRCIVDIAAKPQPETVIALALSSKSCKAYSPALFFYIFSGSPLESPLTLPAFRETSFAFGVRLKNFARRNFLWR